MKLTYKKIMIGVVLGLSVASVSTFASNTGNFHLRLVNQTANKFAYEGYTSTKPNDVKGGGDLAPGANQDYELLTNSKEYLVISYLDTVHHEVVKFDVDFNYTGSGIKFKVEGGDDYYKYSNICIINGNEIFITNK